ncbi:antibiotic biosynthesis monooxygenase [Streptomyces scabiei]|uniref:antibiotic biosynthesis monooxygenase n=1 Tax=Streptomyces scabiei TaxID=1930 RepID=UPI0004E69D14|nr:antibiotic biosynthesis monooxygenase [Streptomyces scabiei]KFG10016.1 antibiotic biosynthesis monooxygenase [Streptomyces scabiei]MDX2837381.1 antibiotic biosynthesis monooxygenase [Streptomyces scabiei]MDX3680408.1 antibiotic biosynthesis monooxygenase [Streptomyces scabiei]
MSEGASGSATVVTSQKVREGLDDEYRRWQEKMNQVVRHFDGFAGTETYPPGPPGSGEERQWVVVFRFSDMDQLTAWLDSTTREELLTEGRPLLEGSPRQEVLAGSEPAVPDREEGVTAVISHDVRQGREEDFEHWQTKVLKAQEKFPGFMGNELFRPVKGIQDHWVVVFRYDTREHLDAWLDSDVRERLLREGREYFSAYDVRKVGSAFSGWFRFGEGAGTEEIPPNWKQAMTVVLALYPTVMVLNLTVGHGFDVVGVPGYLALFFGNVLSVSILTWLLMPLVNRALAFWLQPGRTRTVGVHVAGAAVVVLCWALCILLFGLTTH